MSGKASIAAAQRRRAGQPEQPMRGPYTSINSAQLFNQQQQVQQQGGRVQNAPSGRLAGQHAQLQQQAAMQAALEQRNRQGQQQQQQQKQQQDKPDGFSVIPIPKAVNLLSLRVSRLETALNEFTEKQSHMTFTSETGEQISSGVIDSILSRLDSLEKRSTVTPTAVAAPAAGTNAELTLLKQQVEAIKNSAISSKNLSTAAAKDSKEIKEGLQLQINDLKQTIADLQHLVCENNQKILNLEMGIVPEDFNQDFNQDLNQDFDENLDQVTNIDLTSINLNEIIHQELESAADL
jgi:hypothetical protein